MSWRLSRQVGECGSLSRTGAVGHWARALFANGWPQAWAAPLVLISIAAALKRAAPAASTFAQAVQRVGPGAAASR